MYSPITVGTVVDFPNFDPIFHNAFSNYNGQIFDIGLYPPGTTRSLAFPPRGRSAGVLQYSSHDERRDRGAEIAVLRDSAKNGGFEIAHVPPGIVPFARVS